MSATLGLIMTAVGLILVVGGLYLGFKHARK